MQCNDLRDLELAGVRWELSEFPARLAKSIAAAIAPVAPAAPDVAHATVGGVVGATPQRTPTSIVPPIAPIIPMSVETATAMAMRPADLPALLRMIAEFNHPLRTVATNTVLPHVAQNPNGLVVITDVPGGEDDETGRILSGAAGELLDKMLAAIGMGRECASIMPLVFWRTPGGRSPTRTELDLCRPFVNRALELLHPRAILTLGTLAASEIAGAALPRAHGEITNAACGAKCVPIFHPNYLILKPAAKRDAWTALQKLEKLLNFA